MAQIRVEFVVCGACALDWYGNGCRHNNDVECGWYENAVHIWTNGDGQVYIIVVFINGINGIEPSVFERRSLYHSIDGLYLSPNTTTRRSQIVKIHPENIDLKPFLSIRTIDLYDYNQLFLVDLPMSRRMLIQQIEVNDLDTIVSITTEEKGRMRINHWFDRYYISKNETFCDQEDRYKNWPEMSDIITKCEHRWKTLTDRLINAYRLRHKMRPNGAFLQKLIEKDTDFDK